MFYEITLLSYYVKNKIIIMSTQKPTPIAAIYKINKNKFLLFLFFIPFLFFIFHSFFIFYFYSLSF